MMNPNVSTNCPLQWGDFWAADTTRGITIDTSALGQIFYSIGPAPTPVTKVTNKPRLVMLVKNASGSTLSRNLVVAHTTTTLVSFPYNIAGLAGSLSLVAAGVVEDGYTAGVPDGAIFRMVVQGFHYLQLKTSSDSLSTTIVGQNLCCAGSGEVTGQDNSVAAGSATFAQINSVVGKQCTVTTNVTDSGAQFLAYVNMPWC